MPETSDWLASPEQMTGIAILPAERAALLALLQRFAARFNSLPYRGDLAPDYLRPDPMTGDD